MQLVTRDSMIGVAPARRPDDLATGVGAEDVPAVV